MLKHVRLVAILFIGAALLATTGSPLLEVSAAPPALGPFGRYGAGRRPSTPEGTGMTGE